MSEHARFRTLYAGQKPGLPSGQNSVAPERPADLEVERSSGPPLCILGSGGPAREFAMLDSPWAPNALPVLLGAGMGHALARLLESHDGPVALVDKEVDLLQAADLGDVLAHPRLTHIAQPEAEAALAALSHWQMEHGGKPMHPVVHPFYQRLDRAYYGYVREHVVASAGYDFWGKARAPRFQGPPRLLLITSRYFLVGEVVDACRRQGIEHCLLTLVDDEMASRDFVAELLRLAVEFQPDAVLTLNHLGVDREGVLTDLLARLELPLASWFVDNPHLVLHLYAGLKSPWVTLFTWDADNIPSLQAQGFAHVFHLPLGTDPSRFHPTRLHPDVLQGQPPAEWKAQVSFVGNSMIYKVAQRMKKGRFPRALLLNYHQVAAAFTQCAERSVRDFLRNFSPELATAYDALPDTEARLAYETLLTWEATRQYRTHCVEQLLPFHPLIVGDRAWNQALRNATHTWRWHDALSYYTELPRFYGLSTINFNTTSMQMKGAVNQRVFDVPAAGAFVLTDWHEQMDELFEPGTEMISYRNPLEIYDLVHYYLNHATERQRIVDAGRKRVLAEHTWDHRLLRLLATMKNIYGH